LATAVRLCRGVDAAERRLTGRRRCGREFIAPLLVRCLGGRVVADIVFFGGTSAVTRPHVMWVASSAFMSGRNLSSLSVARLPPRSGGEKGLRTDYAESAGRCVNSFFWRQCRRGLHAGDRSRNARRQLEPERAGRTGDRSLEGSRRWSGHLIGGCLPLRLAMPATCPPLF
jgi:hypothetical protein